jgi:hypothetical protein
MATLDFNNTGTYDHPVYGPVSYRVEDIGYDADGQVARTLGLMGERVREDRADPEFCAWARSASVIGAEFGELPDMEVIDRAYSHVKSAMTFQRDEVTGAGVGNYPAEEVVEVIIRPREMARLVAQGKGMGDCDDFTMYLAGILECFGIPTEFCTVAADQRAPNNYSHVYLVSYPTDDRGIRVRVPLDASHGEYPGWETANKFGRRTQWPVATTGGVMGIVGWAMVGLAAYLVVGEINKKGVLA